MQCPLCLDAPLEPRFVDATEVDVCTRCRGIWLDRGELDRLLADGPRGSDDRDVRDDRGVRDDRDVRDDRARRDDRDVRDAGSRGRDDRHVRDDRARRDDRERRSREPKSRAKRLADLFEEVLDL